MLDAHRWQLITVALRRSVLWAAVFVVALMVTLSFEGQRLETGPSILLALAALVLGGPIVVLVLLMMHRASFIRAASARTNDFSTVYRVAFDADGVQFVDDGAQVDTPWNAYSGWREDSKVVWFYRDGHPVSFLMKHAVSAQDLDILRGFAQAAGVPGVPGETI